MSPRRSREDPRRLQSIALQVAVLGFLRTYPSRLLFDSGEWIVLPADRVGDDETHQHHYVGAEFPTRHGPRCHVFATSRSTAPAAPAAISSTLSTPRPTRANRASFAGWLPEALVQQVMLISSGVLLGLASAKGGTASGVSTEALILAILALCFILVAVQPVAHSSGHPLRLLPTNGKRMECSRCGEESGGCYL